VQYSRYNGKKNVIGTILDWSKRSINDILDEPFVPLVLAMEAVSEMRQEQEEVDNITNGTGYVDMTNPSVLQQLRQSRR
jgi:hypothetical protein